MQEEYYVGQIFEEDYPPEAAEWCNSRGNVFINDIEPVNNVRRFQIQEEPEHMPTYEEVDAMRVAYRQQHIDDKTIARMRKQANRTWTEADEFAYLTLDAEVTAYIEEHFPYPEE